jgi:hypothetical protein
VNKPAAKVGKEAEPCKDCKRPIGPQGAWWERPYALEGYGLCPACHQARWTAIFPGSSPASARKEQPGG